MNHARPASRVVAGSGWARNSKEDWYCKFCSDHWGGHYVVRGSRRECYKCHLPKGQCFDGNVVQLGSPTHRVVQRQPPPTDGGAKRIQQLEAELRRLKQGPTAMASSGTDSTSVDNQELAKLESEVKQLKTMAKEVNGLEGIIAEKEKCVAALRSQQLQAKPGSVRLRQLEGEFKRKQSQLHGVDIRKQKALERIEAEKKVFEKLQAEAVELQAQLAALQADTAKLAEEIQQESEPPPKGNAADSSHGTLHEGAQQEEDAKWRTEQAQIPETSTTEQPSELDAWVAGLDGESQEFAKAQRASMGDDNLLQLRSLLKGKGKGGRPSPYS
jgi:chromosome segregation ATPase